MAKTITLTCRLWGPWVGHPEVADGRWNGRGDLILERHRTIDDESPLIDDDWDFVVPRTMDPNEALSWELDRGYAIIGGRPSAWGAVGLLRGSARQGLASVAAVCAAKSPQRG